jgi:hypothetical protein
MKLKRILNNRFSTGLVVGFILLMAVLIYLYGINPGWKAVQSDFPNYYTGSKLFLSHDNLSEIYDNRWFQRQADKLGFCGEIVSFVPQAPSSVIPYLPLTAFDPLTAKRIWIALNFFLFLTSLWLLHRIFNIKLIWVALIGLSFIGPVANNFLLGQTYIWMLFMVCVAFYLWKRGNDFLTGLIIGFASAIKPFPAFLLIPALHHRKWKIVFGAIVGFIVPNVFIYVIHPEIFNPYVRLILPVTMSGAIQNPFDPSFRSYTVLFRNLFIHDPFRNPHPVWDSETLFIFFRSIFLLIPLFFFFAKASESIKRKVLTQIEYTSLFFIPAIFFAPVSSSYQYVLLIPAILVIARYYKQYMTFAVINILVFFIFASLIPVNYIELAFLIYLLILLGWDVLKPELPFYHSVFVIILLLFFLVPQIDTSSNIRAVAEPVTSIDITGFPDELKSSGENLYFTEIDKGHYVVNLNGKIIHKENANLFEPSVMVLENAMYLATIESGSSSEKQVVSVVTDDKWQNIFSRDSNSITDQQLVPWLLNPFNGPGLIYTGYDNGFSTKVAYPFFQNIKDVRLVDNSIKHKYVEEQSTLYYLSNVNSDFSVKSQTLDQPSKPDLIFDLANARDFDISSNGRLVVWSGYILNNMDIFLYDRLTKEKYILTHNYARDYSPTFYIDYSQESGPVEYVYFISERGGGINDGRIYRVKLDFL